MTLVLTVWSSIGGIARPEYFGEIDYSAELLLLQPEYTNVKMTHSPNSLSLYDAERCSSVDVKAHSQLDAEIICQRHSANVLACRLDDGYEFGFGRTLSNSALHLAVRLEDGAPP